MAKHVKVGDVLEVTFAPAKRGVQTIEPINGRRAFAIDSCDTPRAGDRWSVMVVDMNRTRTVYFVEPLQLVDTPDGLGDVLKPYAPVYHDHIRVTEARLAELLSSTASGERHPESIEAEGDRIAWINPDCTPEERAEAEEFFASFAPTFEEEVSDILDGAFLPEAYVANCMERVNGSLTAH